MWETLFISLFILIAPWCFRVKKSMRNQRVPSIKMMVIAVFAAIAVLFMPIYGRTFDAEPIVMRIFKTILISTHQAIRLFVVDSDFEIIENISGTIDARLYEFYSSYAALLYVIAPIMSFGVVLSFFKNVSSYLAFCCLIT